MCKTFDEISRQVANEFIRTIVFIDDEAYQYIGSRERDGSLAFNSSEISRIFAQQGKICGIYAPTNEQDLNSYLPILNKADVVVLDWCINFSPVPIDISDWEEDVLEQDDRGIYTQRLLEQLVADSKDSLKLIIIYTGEQNLNEIRDQISQRLTGFMFDKESFSLTTSNVTILLRQKCSASPDSKDLTKVSYEELPELILTSFAKMTEGLLSDFALMSITAIRENTFKLLHLFSPQLDIAYLGHRVLQVNDEDSKQMLIRVFGDIVCELLINNLNKTSKWIPLWIDKYIVDNELEISGAKLSVTKKLLNELIKCDLGDTFHEKLRKNPDVTLQENQFKRFAKNSSALFKYGDVDIEKSNIDFAMLTHHKNVLKPQIIPPVLTLGTVVKIKETQSADSKNSPSETFYLCIQQKCDSVRLSQGETRRFLFLPLEEKSKVKSIGGVICVNGKPMYVDNKSYKMRTIKIKSVDSDNMKVIARSNKDGWYFESLHGEKLYWVVDIKETYALMILNRFCAQLSRVGVDEFEWLRSLETR